MADSWEDIDEHELEKNIADKIKAEQAKQQGMSCTRKSLLLFFFFVRSLILFVN